MRLLAHGHTRLFVAAFVAAGATTNARSQPSATATPIVALSDRVFAYWDSGDRPGCTVGVDRDGQPRFTKAYGLADLEFGVPATAGTIYEAGSVSKQFTAAATVLLALDGKLTLDDDIRRYVPELPVYERPITIRHLLNHTSGLRDWGDLVQLAGWRRGTKTYTHDDVLDILSRQRALNYPVGDRYSYTNSGYNLLAIIISRVSGMPFARFSEERVFGPLGLLHTSWRDDYTRVVKGRAQAYDPTPTGWVLDMPFENVHGNGGLLTTVGDLLTWLQVLEHPRAEFRAMVDAMHVQGRLTDGSTISYALGLFVDEYRGVRRVSHSGATAGYRAQVIRFPGKGLAVSVLCNDGNANPVALANQLVDSLLAPSLGPNVAAAARPPRPSSPAFALTAEQAAEYAGEYFSPDAELTLRITAEDGKLVLFRRPATRLALQPTAKDSFGGGGTVQRFWVTRNATGKIVALHTASSRAYDVVFERR